ncbi:MAG: polysaccharide biosynthesis tyrosine autokinase [Fibrobacter sp.]|jgi:tyrosine-protein kinase Etk/Wzc|nr:polysaccharide biosynthesis tyrosine autokinase [Fibrobacter sp.]
MALVKEEKNELGELFSDILREWKIVVGCVFLAGVLGLFTAFWIRPVYQVNALLQVESKAKNSAGMGDLTSLFSQGTPAETEVELVKSRRVIGTAVEALGLRNVAMPMGFWDRLLHREGRLELSGLVLPEKKNPTEKTKKKWMVEATDSFAYNLLDTNGVKVLSGKVGENASALYKGDTVFIGVSRMEARPGQRFTVESLLRLDAINAFIDAFTVGEKGKKTGILEFTYEDYYSDRAVNVLNEVANAYLRSNVESRSAEAEKTLNFLEEQLPAIKDLLDSSEEVLNDYRLQVGSVDVTTETRIVLENQMRMQQQILELQQQRQETVRLFHQEHPAVKTLDDRINALNQEQAKIGLQIKRLPSKQQDVLRLMSEVELNKLLYVNLINNIQRMRLVAAGEVGSVRIVDYAEDVTVPVRPAKKMILAVALFLGFCVSVGLITLKKKMRSGVRDSRVIERELGVSVYAKIPKGLQPAEKTMMPLAVTSPDDIAVESMRTLRTSLEFMMESGKGNVIAVSGLIPGVGKSFISVNVAALFAASGKHVLLIDADLRKGRLHKEFGKPRDNGLADLLLGDISIEEAVLSVGVPNLSLIVTGKVPGSASELLGSSRYSELMEKLRTIYDVIIVDTPPVMLVTDAMLVCRHADQAVMVVEYDRHSIGAIQEGFDLFTKGAPESLHKSIVINKFVHSRNDGYGYKYGKYE